MFCTLVAFGDLPSDLNDRMYTYIDLWEGKGLISGIPPLRPYPIQYLKEIFKEVMRRGGEDAGIAGEFLESINPDFSLKPTPGHESRFTPDAFYGETGSDFPFVGNLHPLVSYSGRAAIWLVDRQQGDLLPFGAVSERDYLEDWSDFDLFGRKVFVRQSLALSTTIGTSSVYLSLGLNRNSFGPFFENGVILGPQAPHAGTFNFTWRLKKTILTIAHFMLTATNETGKGRYPGKYMSLHGLQIFPFSWLEVGVFESIVYGGRLEPLYLIPLSEFFYFQGIIGFLDNAMFGASVKIRFFEDVQYMAVLYIDDLHFNDMVRFDFDTKYKVAVQTGITWTPLYTYMKRIAFDYTMVTPYTYSHIDSGINYQNYTHAGVNLGPALEPNSDRLSLDILITPRKWIDVTLMSRFIRHGNASAGYTDGDGSIFDDGFDDSGQPTFQDSTRFLTQDILEYNFQIGAEGDLRIPLGKGVVTAKAGYTLEYWTNKDFTNEKELSHIFTIGTGYLF